MRLTALTRNSSATYRVDFPAAGTGSGLVTGVVIDESLLRALFKTPHLGGVNGIGGTRTRSRSCLVAPDHFELDPGRPS
jgi:hypothetical protein